MTPYFQVKTSIWRYEHVQSHKNFGENCEASHVDEEINLVFIGSKWLIWWDDIRWVFGFLLMSIPSNENFVNVSKRLFTDEVHKAVQSSTNRWGNIPKWSGHAWDWMMVRGSFRTFTGSTTSSGHHLLSWSSVNWGQFRRMKSSWYYASAKG